MALKKLTAPFFQEGAGAKQLEDALNFDWGHISKDANSSGPHVFKIQEALRVLMDAKLPPNETGPSRYGAATADAVFAFKDKFHILGPGQSTPDKIVGKGTMDRLDIEMRKKQLGGPEPPPPAAVKSQDILVHILGQDPTVKGVAGTRTDGGQLGNGIQSVNAFNGKVNVEPYLTNHFELIHAQWFGGLSQFGSDPTDEIVKFVNGKVERIKEEKHALGRILIAGVSSGGRNVVTVASALAGKNIPVTYAGAGDAAFNNADDPARGASNNAVRSENFFQSAANGVIEGDEFHGSVTTFKRNVDFVSGDASGVFASTVAALKAATTTKQKEKFTEALHGLACRQAYSNMHEAMIRILNG